MNLSETGGGDCGEGEQEWRTDIKKSYKVVYKMYLILQEFMQTLLHSAL